jgi:hypothetical protein
MSLEALRRNPMMEYLIDALAQGKDIGHYGRLTVAMVGQYFMQPDELVKLLSQDRDVSDAKARALVRQVTERRYSPPKRERILEWQAKQEFPLCPDPNDPDACNVYSDLEFPDDMYEHIEEYREQQIAAAQH